MLTPPARRTSLLPLIAALLAVGAPIVAGPQARQSPPPAVAGKGTIYVSTYKGTIAVLDEATEKITREIPVGRFGQDGDLDGALLLLASNAGSYIAGATIVCDGGQMVALRG